MNENEIKQLTKSEALYMEAPEGKRLNIRVDFLRETYWPSECIENVQGLSIGRDAWGQKCLDVDYIQHETEYKGKSCEYASIESVKFFLDSDEPYANDTWSNCVGIWKL